MQPQDNAGAQAKRPLRILYMSANNFQRQVELSNAVFGLATRNLVGVCEYGGSFGDAMAIA